MDCLFLKNTPFVFDQLVMKTANKISSIISMMVEFVLNIYSFWQIMHLLVKVML